jgi:glucosamine 6-phosphate synthetase-like amidotransferase/phosphosugar isomerase protein
MRVLKDMKQLGADTLALVEKSNGNDADYIIELESGVHQEARDILMLPFLQLLSFYTATSKGLNPDKPTNLSSVVRL